MLQLRILLLVSTQPTSTMRAEIAAGQQPRRDYDALQQALGADALYLNDALNTRFVCILNRVFGPYIALVWASFCRRHAYDVFYTDTELLGLPLSMLLKLSVTCSERLRHVTLSHYISPLKKRIFFYLGVGSHIDTVIVHCASQWMLATKHLHIPAKRVVKLPYFVDEQFWRPVAYEAIGDDTVKTSGTGHYPIICAAGLEFRDYPTLLTAINGLDVHVCIAACSAFVRRQISANSLSETTVRPASFLNLPPNVTVASYNYMTMRRLYAASQFVVVPLQETDFQAGIAVILEAMAMGKAVIVSGTRGQTDVLRDPRNDGRGPVVREWWSGFLDVPGIAETLGSLPTGFYVTPGDPDELRERIQYLLDHPAMAEELGRNGRRVVEAYFGLDAFTRRFAAAICGESHPELAYHPRIEASR